MLVNTLSSGVAAVRNELIFKRKGLEPGMPFMVQNIVLYTWGLGMNLASWRVCGRHVYFLEGFSPAVWISVVCASLLGLMCALMLRYLDNVVRCFSGVAQMLVTVVASRLLPARMHQSSFDVYFVASLALLSVALVLYQ